MRSRAQRVLIRRSRRFESTGFLAECRGPLRVESGPCSTGRTRPRADAAHMKYTVPHYRLPLLNKEFMRRLIVLLSCTATVAACATPPFIPPAGPLLEESAQVTDLAPNFAALWARTDGQPIDQRVASFKEDIGRRFPAFYNIARYAGQRTQVEQDAIIRCAILRFIHVILIRQFC